MSESVSDDPKYRAAIAAKNSSSKFCSLIPKWGVMGSMRFPLDREQTACINNFFQAQIVKNMYFQNIYFQIAQKVLSYIIIYLYKILTF